MGMELLDWATIKNNLTAIAANEIREQVKQSGFTCAVGANQACYTAFLYGNPRTINGFETTKTFTESLGTKKGVIRCCLHITDYQISCKD